MALEDVFSFATSQIATIASIIVIVIAAVKGINKSSEARMQTMKAEILETSTNKFTQIDASIENLRREMVTMMEYLRRDLERLEHEVDKLRNGGFSNWRHNNKD